MSKRKHPDQKLTLRKFAEKYYYPMKPHLAPSTFMLFRITLRRWERLTDNPPIEEIDKRTIHEFRAACDDIKTVSINSQVVNIRTLLNWAVEMEVLSFAPKIRKVPIRRPKPTVPPLEDIGKLYAAAHVAVWPKKTNVSPQTWWQTFFVLAYFTAARISDLRNSLLWSNVDDDWLVFTAGKIDWEHDIPLHPVLKRHLLKMEKNKRLDDRILYVSPKQSNNHAILRELRRISTAAGLAKPIVPKLFRQLSLTQYCIAGGADAGRFVHGLGTRSPIDHYLDPRPILQNASENLNYPPEFDGKKQEVCHE